MKSLYSIYLYSLLGLAIASPLIDIPTIVADMNNVSNNLLTLHRAVNRYDGTPEIHADLQRTETKLEADLTTTTDHVEQLTTLSVQDSKTLTETAVAIKNPVNRYLQSVVLKKSLFEKADYDDSMRDNLKRFQDKANKLGETLQKKVLPGDVQTVKECSDEVNRSFAEALGKFT